MVRQVSHPRLSIVVIARDASLSLDHQLSLIGSLVDRSRVEVVVVGADSRGIVDSMRLAYPNLRFIATSDDQGVRALRRRGMDEATGDVVMLLDGNRPLEERCLRWMLRSVGLIDSSMTSEAERRSPTALEIGRTG